MAGGNGAMDGAIARGGGGGGAGAAGSTSAPGGRAGAGGDGKSFATSGANVTYAGGGGGGGENNDKGAAGGTGGGGDGAKFSGASAPTSGTANTGGGSGGGSNTATGGSGIVIIKYLTVPDPPDPITDLAASGTTADSTILTYTEPALNGGSLQNYVFNYTTPCGEPLTPLTNGTTATSYTVSGLDGAVCYSFRAAAATERGINTVGANIVNVTTLAFNPGNFTVGYLDFEEDNPDQVPLWFTKTVNNSTSTTLTVTYPDTWDLACDFHYQFAMTNQTYSNLTQTVVSATQVSSAFIFTTPGNDVIDVKCWDQNDLLHNGKYVITQADFVFLQLLQNFTNGEYGTQGDFGSIDIIFLFAIIISMIGLNRINESVGAGFCIMIMGGLAYFEIIQWETFAMSSVALVVLAIILSTRKD